MAIRKFRKGMKPFVWIITIIFLLGSAMVYLGSLKGANLTNLSSNEVAFRINKTDVTKLTVERGVADISRYYPTLAGTSEARNIVGTIAADDVINKYLTLELADQLKIKVSSAEVKDEYNRIKDTFDNEQQLITALAAQGLTRATLKKEIEKQLRINKIFDTTKSDTVNESELLFKIAEMKHAMAVKNIAPEYANYIPKVEKTIDGINISNVDIAKNILSILALNMNNDTKISLEEAIAASDESLQSQVKVIREAISAGVEINEFLSLEEKYSLSKLGLYKVYKSAATVDDAELKAFFETNKVYYNKEASVDSDLIILDVKPSKEDLESAKNNATNLLKELTVENFAQKAQEFSKDTGSGANGGDLGWFTKEVMIPEFSEVAFKGEVGAIYPELVETKYGYHIILVKGKRTNNGVEEVSAAHILFTPEPSEQTRASVLSDSNELLIKLEQGKIDLINIKDKYKNALFADNIQKISDSGYITGIGFLENLTKNIFVSEINKYNLFEENGYIFIYRKTAEVKKEDADFENKDTYNQVLDNYTNQKAAEKLREIAN